MREDFLYFIGKVIAEPIFIDMTKFLSLKFSLKNGILFNPFVPNALFLYILKTWKKLNLV